MSPRPCVLLLGPPCAGKTTLTGSILDKHGLTHFAVRLFFAHQIDLNTKIGKAAEPFVRAHAWIPDDVVVQGLDDYLSRQDIDGSAGVLLEGLPGNRRQTELLSHVLTTHDLTLYSILYVDVSDDIARERASKRFVCGCDGGVRPVINSIVCPRCGKPVIRRNDDSELLFKKRLALHRDLICRLKEVYPSSLWKMLDGSLSPHLIAASVERSLKGMDRRGKSP